MCGGVDNVNISQIPKLKFPEILLEIYRDFSASLQPYQGVILKSSRSPIA